MKHWEQIKINIPYKYNRNLRIPGWVWSPASDLSLWQSRSQTDARSVCSVDNDDDGDFDDDDHGDDDGDDHGDDLV